MELKSTRNCHALYNLQYHLIFVTKYKKPCIMQDVFETVKSQAVRVAALCGAEIQEIAYEADHIHMLLSVPPQVKLSALVNSIKSTTTRAARKQHGDYLQHFYWKPYFWSRSYMVLSAGGAPIEVIRKYIQEQGTPEHSEKKQRRGRLAPPEP